MSCSGGFIQLEAAMLCPKTVQKKPKMQLNSGWISPDDHNAIGSVNNLCSKPVEGFWLSPKCSMRAEKSYEGLVK